MTSLQLPITTPQRNSISLKMNLSLLRYYSKEKNDDERSIANTAGADGGSSSLRSETYVYKTLFTSSFALPQLFRVYRLKFGENGNENARNKR
jgi:hypothetical protein